MKKQLRVTRLAAALAVLLATAPVYAQQTSANLAGRITDNDGASLAGAEVTILHTPSGTTSRAVTDASGRYTARGLRVGGPYTVTVVKEGFRGEASENVYLLLGETAAVNVDLDPAATELERSAHDIRLALREQPDAVYLLTRLRTTYEQRLRLGQRYAMS